jgi:hypothetical protein
MAHQRVAERNCVFHNQIRQYISDCHWGHLAEQLCRDLKELLNVAPDPDTAARYEEVLLSIQKEYFDVIIIIMLLLRFGLSHPVHLNTCFGHLLVLLLCFLC